MSEPQRYVKRPVECEAMKLDGYGDFIRARDWINDNGGTAYAMSDGKTDKVTIVMIDGNIADVFEGWYVIKGIAGEFYPCRADIFEASHSPVEEPVVAEPLVPLVTYVSGRPDGATTLVGGVALKLDGEDQ